jgi:3-oxoacyl-[acyl-carrier-protein] synthase-3
MRELNAVITGVASYVPDYILNNEELSTIVDTNDAWIMSRIGIKERRILKEKGVGSSYMGALAVQSLLKKTNTKPEDIEVIICATSTPDYTFPSTAAIIAEKNGIKNAFAFDLSAACSGFIFALDTATAFIKSGKYKKVIVVAAEKMSSITNYSDRTTCPLFGDASGAVLVEPTEDNFGIIDSILHTDGVGIPNLQLKAGGSACPASHDTVDQNLHTVYQEGQIVFKYAVSKMADVSAEIMEKNNLTHDDIAWFVPHQANMRIIDAAANRMELSKDKVMINIQKYGNTSAATLPLCLSEWESQLKKGDNIILSAFGAGFTWGAIYLKWGYDGKKTE